MSKLNCFTKFGRDDLQELFDKEILKGNLSEKELASKILADEHKSLHDLLNSLKSKAGISTDEYVPFDNSTAVKEINDRYEKIVNEIPKTIKPAPILTQIPSNKKESTETTVSDTTVESFTDRVASGEQMSSPEDLQFYENNREAIETELKKKFAESTTPEFTEDTTLEERTKISDALFAFADKILKADITGAGGGAALSNIFAIPQQILGRAIQAIAVAVKAGETIASAINKGIQSLKDEGYTVDEKEFTGFANSIIAGEKPRVRTTGKVVEKEVPFESKPQDEQSEESGEYNFGERKFVPGKDPISQHKLKTIDVDKAFGTDVTAQNVWNDTPSEDRFKKQVDMLDDGKEMIGLAQTMFGGPDVKTYGPDLLRYIKSMPPTSGNKKAILLATFLGEIKNEMERTQSQELQQLYNNAFLYYRDFMHTTAKNLSAGRLLRLFRDKYMADIFQDIILEEQQVKDSKNVNEAVNDTDISDADASAFEEKKKTGKPKEQTEKEAEAAKKAAEQKRKDSDVRPKGKKDVYADLYKKKEDEVKAKHGDKKSLYQTIIDKINKLNCP